MPGRPSTSTRRAVMRDWSPRSMTRRISPAPVRTATPRDVWISHLSSGSRISTRASKWPSRAAAFTTGALTQLIKTKESYRGLGPSQYWVDDFTAVQIKVIGTIKLICYLGLILAGLGGVAARRQETPTEVVLAE